MKYFLLYLTFFITSFTSLAQVGAGDGAANPKREEKIKALYVAYITQQLSLTAGEAEKFWPLHAQYDAELRSINDNNMDEIDRQQAILNVKKKYVSGFNKILGNERSNNFYKQDGEFRKKMVERLKQLRQQRLQNKPPAGNQGLGGRRRSLSK